jgi:hypothetical protein
MVKANHPVPAIKAQSRQSVGSGLRRSATMAERMMTAMTNRMPANVNGGKSSRPSLMNSHVEPQIKDRMSQTSTGSFERCVAAKRRGKFFLPAAGTSGGTTGAAGSATSMLSSMDCRDTMTS